MGLIQMVLVGLCFNATCQDEDLNDFIIINGTMISKNIDFNKRVILQNLAQELKGMHLRIATVQNGVLSSAIMENGTWVGKGAAFDIIHTLQQKFGFHYTVILPKENSLGSNRSGIFGLLSNNQADLGAAFLPMTSIYWQYARFATSLDVGEWVIVLKRPQESATGSGLLAPFNLNIWLLILVSLLAVGPIMYLVVSAHRKYCQNKHEKAISLTNCMWFVYGALLKQGTVLTPAADSSRLVFATWWIFITILTAFYTANLTAFLTLSEFTLPLKGPDDIRIKKYPWVTHSGSVIEEVSSNKDEELYRLLKHSRGRFIVEDGSEILRTWVTQRNYMYIAERPTVDVLAYEEYLNKVAQGVPESKRCTYVFAPFTIFRRPRTFAYAKNFKFGPLFNNVLGTLVEVGIAKYYLSQSLPNVKICPLNLGNKERQLRNTDLLLTYYIVAVGFTTAILIFIIEVFLKQLNKNKVGKNNNVKKNFGNELNFGQFAPPPPPYNELFFNSTNISAKKQLMVNGRNYWVMKSVENGSTRLVPVRTPSALLFNYTS